MGINDVPSELVGTTFAFTMRNFGLVWLCFQIYIFDFVYFPIKVLLSQTQSLIQLKIFKTKHKTKPNQALVFYFGPI